MHRRAYGVISVHSYFTKYPKNSSRVKQSSNQNFDALALSKIKLRRLKRIKMMPQKLSAGCVSYL